jgi:hypothetical protein
LLHTGLSLGFQVGLSLGIQVGLFVGGGVGCDEREKETIERKFNRLFVMNQTRQIN